MGLYIANEKEIIDGEATDVYFTRVKTILEKEGLKDIKVRAEFHVYGLPEGYRWAVFSGLEEALYVMKGRAVDIYSLPEGTIFYEREPIMLIEGKYYDFAEMESIVLGILRHYSSITTRAARMRLAAGNKTLLFFGIRSLHPALAPMADRAAYIGGVDAVSGVLSKKYNNLEPTGTMPHSLIIVFNDQSKAWLSFDKYMDPKVPRIMLVDTFWDERAEALLAARTLGKRLQGVRLDTPSSRRGDMKKIVEEVRWALDIEGFKDVKIIVSGGLDESDLIELRDIADGFGVGTSIAFPPSIDISMDIVEVEEEGRWIPRSKRGKLPGAKQLYACSPTEHYVVPWASSPPLCKDGRRPTPLMIKQMEEGKIIAPQRSLEELKSYVVEQLKQVQL
ncbi:MAG: nicotinate phosphoribosyltransferase [Fervidicoccaceae archaeon]